jgi:alkylation response protein AidB-like acyl-CoA dehydrogenase
LKDAYKILWEGEWWRLGLPAELGGYGIPPTVQWAAAELILGSNPAAFMYMAGPNFATVMHRNGNDEQKHWAEANQQIIVSAKVIDNYTAEVERIAAMK